MFLIIIKINLWQHKILEIVCYYHIKPLTSQIFLFTKIQTLQSFCIYYLFFFKRIIEKIIPNTSTAMPVTKVRTDVELPVSGRTL